MLTPRSVSEPWLRLSQLASLGALPAGRRIAGAFTRQVHAGPAPRGPRSSRMDCGLDTDGASARGPARRRRTETEFQPVAPPASHATPQSFHTGAWGGRLYRSPERSRSPGAAASRSCADERAQVGGVARPLQRNQLYGIRRHRLCRRRSFLRPLSWHKRLDPGLSPAHFNVRAKPGWRRSVLLLIFLTCFSALPRKPHVGTGLQFIRHSIWSS